MDLINQKPRHREAGTQRLQQQCNPAEKTPSGCINRPTSVRIIAYSCAYVTREKQHQLGIQWIMPLPQRCRYLDDGRRLMVSLSTTPWLHTAVH